MPIVNDEHPTRYFIIFIVLCILAEAILFSALGHAPLLITYTLVTVFFLYQFIMVVDIIIGKINKRRATQRE